jgi:hypothetical protein
VGVEKTAREREARVRVQEIHADLEVPLERVEALEEEKLGRLRVSTREQLLLLLLHRRGRLVQQRSAHAVGGRAVLVEDGREGECRRERDIAGKENKVGLE